MLNSTEFKRLTIVLALALTGVLLSFIFLKPEGLDSGQVRPDSLAYVLELNNDVQKKTSRDLIWHIALPGDELYGGDLIRTSKDSTALLEFHKTKSRIHLSEDSTIVIDNQEPAKMNLTIKPQILRLILLKRPLLKIKSFLSPLVMKPMQHHG